VPQYAPVPASSAGLPLGPGGYAVQAFEHGACMVTEGAYQGLQSSTLYKELD
jgi:hypothetical protein